MSALLSFDYLNEVCDGDESMKMDIINEFIRYIPADLEKLLNYFNEARIPEFDALLHKIKTPILMIATEDIKERIIKLEKKTKEVEDLTPFENQILESINDVNNILEALRQYAKVKS